MICDEFIVVVEVVNQKEKLLIVLGWQWFDALFEVVQTTDCLINNLLF
jgi:hypothetical protein